MEEVYKKLDNSVAVKLIAKTVAKATGDIRVAFAIYKNSLIKVMQNVIEELKRNSEFDLSSSDMIKLEIPVVTKLIREKHENKTKQILENMPQNNWIIMQTILNEFTKTGNTVLNGEKIYNQYRVEARKIFMDPV